jgi:hypothetical protein
VPCAGRSARGPIRCQGRDAGKEERGSPAGGQGPIRCVRIGVSKLRNGLDYQVNGSEVIDKPLNKGFNLVAREMRLCFRARPLRRNVSYTAW